MKEKTAERWKQKSKGLTERRFPAAPLYLRLPQEAWRGVWRRSDARRKRGEQKAPIRHWGKTAI